MKFAKLTLGVIWLFFSLLPLQAAPDMKGYPNNWVTYQDPEYQFQISYPADWILTRKPDAHPGSPGNVISIQPKAKGRNFISFTITDFALPSSRRKTLADVKIKESKAVPKKYLKEFSIGKERWLEIGSIECQEEFEGDSAGCLASFDYYADASLNANLYPSLDIGDLDYKRYSAKRIDPSPLFSKEVAISRKILETLKF